MQLEKIDLREIHLQLIHPFETSFGTTTHRRILIIRAPHAHVGQRRVL